MIRVITISLDGKAYPLEDAGYEALRAYLETAGARLAHDPDREEIIADLERAIAEKFGRWLGPHRNVLGAVDVERVLAELGPVDVAAPGTEAGAGSAARSAGARLHAAPKRLYRVQEGALLSGVCAGFAAYFNLDVTIVRILFIIGTLVTGGLGILAYVVMMFVIPQADSRTGAGSRPP
ncbi:MAG: PspC domain-containing protein [Gammaproteobacteria bacterium]|nr:PspC domain-containing protein [Gammaproteobacteria bacterium]